MAESSPFQTALADALAVRKNAEQDVIDLRESLRVNCEHALVVEGRGESWQIYRVCLACGSAETGYAGSFHMLGNPGRLIKTDSKKMPDLDDPNVRVQFFAWCKALHFQRIRYLPYGWCNEHMPESVREQRRRDDAREAYYNSPG